MAMEAIAVWWVAQSILAYGIFKGHDKGFLMRSSHLKYGRKQEWHNILVSLLPYSIFFALAESGISPQLCFKMPPKLKENCSTRKPHKKIRQRKL